MSEAPTLLPKIIASDNLNGKITEDLLLIEDALSIVQDLLREFANNDGRLNILLDRSLTVLGEADLAGIIDADGGDFFATGEGVAFTGDRVQLSASDSSKGLALK